MHFRSVCAWLLMWVLIGLDCVFSHDSFSFCTSHVHSFFMHMFFLFFPILSMCCVMFCSLSLLDRLHYGTQIAQIYSGSEPSSRFRVILFVSSSHTLSYSVLWWEGQGELLWELLGSWHSSRMPGHFAGFFQHYITRCNSDSGMGISLWETRALSRRVYSGVLLQHTRHRYLYALICFYTQRYTYRSYSRCYI